MSLVARGGHFQKTLPPLTYSALSVPQSLGTQGGLSALSSSLLPHLPVPPWPPLPSPLACGPWRVLPGSRLSCWPLSWRRRRRQLQATGICDHLSEAPLPPQPAFLGHFYPMALETGFIQAWEDREVTGGAISALPEGQALSYELAVTLTRGTNGLSNQRSHSPYTVHRTPVSLVSAPSELPSE